MFYYRLHQACLILVIISVYGCASHRSVITAENANSPSKNYPATYVSTGNEIVATAKSLIGTPYLFGGSTPNGLDCSGLVFYSYQSLGISVGRTTRQLAMQATTVTENEMKPGDLLFFRTYGKNVSHVGIYAGENQFIHAPKSGKVVSFADIDQAYWKNRLIKAGRLH